MMSPRGALPFLVRALLNATGFYALGYFLWFDGRSVGENIARALAVVVGAGVFLPSSGLRAATRKRAALMGQLMWC